MNRGRLQWAGAEYRNLEKGVGILTGFCHKAYTRCYMSHHLCHRPPEDFSRKGLFLLSGDICCNQPNNTVTKISKSTLTEDGFTRPFFSNTLVLVAVLEDWYEKTISIDMEPWILFYQISIDANLNPVLKLFTELKPVRISIKLT